jgi:PAS domain S-box-containing protein
MKHKNYKDFIRALNGAAIITETNLQGEIIFANEKFIEISGYSEKELLGNTHSIVNSGKHRKKFFTNLWKTITSGEVWCGEVCNRKKNGELYWVHAIIFPICERKSDVVYKYAAIRFDITEKKEIELLLKKTAANYQSVIDVTDGFCHIQSNGQIIEVSDGYCQLTGYHRDELLKMNILDMDEDFSITLVQFASVIKSDSKTIEIEQHRKNGKIWVAEITVSYSTLQDGSLFIFLHDVTERKEVEKNNKELQRQVIQMQKIDSIGRLTAGIAHDFNNILSGILGYNEVNSMIVANLPDSEDKANFKHNLIQIDTGVHRGIELISKMLTYCRQAPAKKVMDVKPTFDVITEVIELLKSGLTTKYNIELELDEELLIQIDSTDLHQIITNLVLNARDSMPNGNIKIELKAVEGIDCKCTACLENVRGNFISLSVSDNGSGIESDIISKVFDPFFTTKKVGEGTGLGLSVISGLVHNAQGHILLDSKIYPRICKGTTFQLLFPYSIDVGA